MAKPSGSQQVEEYLKKLEHPLKSEIEEVRSIILSLDKEHSEHVKWNAPSYRYYGDDRVTFNLHGKGFFRLVLHRGAKAKDDSADLRPLFEDAQGMMEWAAQDRAMIRFTDMQDVEAKREMLKDVIRRWVDAIR